MAMRTDNEVTLTHAEAQAIFGYLRDYASAQADHASRTKSAAVRAHCRTTAENVRALSESIMRRCYTWTGA